MVKAFSLNCCEGFRDKLKLGACRSVAERAIYLATEASDVGKVNRAPANFFLIDVQTLDECLFDLQEPDIIIAARHKMLALEHRVQASNFCMFLP